MGKYLGTLVPVYRGEGRAHGKEKVMALSECILQTRRRKKKVGVEKEKSGSGLGGFLMYIRYLCTISVYSVVYRDCDCDCDSDSDSDRSRRPQVSSLVAVILCAYFTRHSLRLLCLCVRST